MKYCQYPVHPSLQNLIRYFWSYDANSAESGMLHIQSFADCYPRLIFQDLNISLPIYDGNHNIMPVCFLSGLDTKSTDAYWENTFSHFGVSFFPHALHTFFRIDASGITDQMPDILVLDKTEIPGILLKAENHKQRVLALSKYFYSKLKTAKPDLIINDLIHRPIINQLGRDSNFSKIASHYTISERQLQRRFKQNIGVSASKFNRIVKFEKALQLLPSSGYGELTQLAYELDYTDQSHFINDFKSFSGLSPYDFIRKNSLGAESASFIYENNNI